MIIILSEWGLHCIGVGFLRSIFLFLSSFSSSFFPSLSINRSINQSTCLGLDQIAIASPLSESGFPLLLYLPILLIVVYLNGDVWFLWLKRVFSLFHGLIAGDSGMIAAISALIPLLFSETLN